MAVSATIAVAAALAVTNGSASAADQTNHRGTPGVSVSSKSVHRAAAKGALPRVLGGSTAAGEPGSALPAGVPAKGRYAFLIKLGAASTGHAYRTAIGGGKAAAHTAAKKQLGTVSSAQSQLVSHLPSGSKVLFKTHSALAAVAVTTDVKNYAQLTRLAGVAAVYPIAPKSATNAYAVPLQGAPEGWEAHSNLGANSTVAIIDTGIDYTHADFGGVGTVDEYQASKAQQGQPVSANEFPGDKVIGGYDLAGDAYDAGSGSPDAAPSPDPWPLDCNGHGSHVAGTVAGYGENSDGTTYTGAYNTSTPFDQLKIGPGMAPKAKLYAYRVFGCDGTTNLVAAALDMASDPNGDGDPSDHVDVVNMSLGSDYGSPQDGDTVATEAASALGITMVIASGNAGDIYDVGGSPGDAPSAITAAASQDASAIVDALNVDAPASIAGKYAAERSVAYGWTHDADLSGDVARVSDPDNLQGCKPLSAADAAAVKGKIAFVEWTDIDDQRPCGSVTRSGNLVAAGAIGFIFADDREAFAAGITGSAVIPGVLVAKSGGDAIREELVAGHTVHIASTTSNGFNQLDTSLNDTLAGFSSRGIGDPGNVKPDITAVGASVFSAGVGTGTEGLNDSGTSMATPMTAGAAALVVTAHPDWRPEQVKADLMNTAGADVYTGTNHTGDKYAPQRVGAGRLEVDRALDNDVLAYVTDDPGSVGVSFGPQPVTAPTEVHKTVKVENTGLSAQTFHAFYSARSSVPGATYSVSPSDFTVAARSSKTVTVTLTLDPSAMVKTVDPTVQLLQGGLPRQFQADASGLLELHSDASGLRVPVYSAPRPASAMTQADGLTLPTGDVETALLPLVGQSVNQGSDAQKVQSLVAGLELQGTSGLAPSCGGEVTSGCVNFSDERSADLKRFGATSDAPQLASNGDNPLQGGTAYFAVNTQGRWRTAANQQEFDIYIDGNGDGVPDSVLFNTRLPDTDVLVTEIVDLNTGEGNYVAPINASFGDTDTAVFDSDTMVLPVPINDIPGVDAEHSRIGYAVFSFSPNQGPAVDHIGDVDDSGHLVGAMSMDVLKPGVALFGSYDGSASPFLFPDAPSSVLSLRRDAAAYVTDGGLGAMMVHFHNQLGSKTQVVQLKVDPTVDLALAPNPADRGQDVTATITVPAGSDATPTGTVTLKRGSSTVASGALSNGSVQLHVSFADAGTYPLHAEYSGDENHNPGSSDPTNLVVKNSGSSLVLTAFPGTVSYNTVVTTKVRITTLAGTPATGTVAIRRLNGTVLGSGPLVNGVATIKYTNKLKGQYAIKATYSGDGNYAAGISNVVTLKYKR